jgi:class 3 adenylate cyclase
VLASAEVVSRCAPGALHATALATNMGAFKLKGVPEPVEVYAVK